MNMKLQITAIAVLLAGAASAQATLQQHSVTPPLVTLNTTAFPSTQVYSLIGSRDSLVASPGYRFGGSADGAGVLRNNDGTFTIVVNHEDNFAVSRLILDSSFRPVTGEYLLNSNAGMWRLCSATLATPQEHGFGPAFLTCGESGIESMTHSVNIFANPITDSLTAANSTVARGLGRWSAENAVPLPAAAYNKTVIIIGDDDSGPNGGQVAMYVSNNIGDLNNGKVYVLRRTDLNQRERSILPGQTYQVEFVEVPNASTLTGAQLDAYSSQTLNCIEFQRVEDIDYRKGGGAASREIYFNATGAATADSIDRTVWGRVYRLILDPNDPLRGTLECIIDGDDKSTSNPYRALYQPDNICVTQDYVYVQEDPNGYSFAAALPYVHDARIYQYDIQTGAFVQFLELDHHRSAVDSAVYNRNSAGTAFSRSGTGSWEYGAMIDLSSVDIPNAFMICLQPHTWRYPEFSGVDGGTLRPNEKQGSLLITVTNVPRVKITTPVVVTDTLCNGNTAVLSATGGNSYWATNGTRYHWYTQPTGGLPVFTGSTYNTPVLTTNVTYYVETEVDGVVGSSRTPVPVIVNQTPAQPVINQNGTSLVSSSTVGNQWYRNGVLIPNATTPTILITQDGYYTVIVTINGCPSPVSNEIFMNVTSVEESALINNVRVFPNPNDGTFTINFISEPSEIFNIEVVNSIGQVVYTEKVANYNGRYNQQLDLSTNADGVYIVNIYTDNGIFQQQLVKQH
ncbi:MAG: T9SS type A sorting domain-containing protein [Bacteroidia bacterium]